jgi:uncharacterized protein (AIM24 family)
MTRRKLIELDDAHGRTAVTEEFLLHLHRSSDLLQSDRAQDARDAIEQAFEAQPEDPSGQATLALVYFKLGLYPRAIAIYRKLIARHPRDPVLLLNLALVYFKTGQTEAARDALERVVAIEPGYHKAFGYLGLAHQRLGDFARAREAFAKAGADHLAARMARFVEPDPQTMVAANDSGEPTPSTDVDQLPAPPSVGELAQSTRLSEPAAGQFLIDDTGYLLVDVVDRVFTRLVGLHFSSSSGLSYQVATRQQRAGDAADPFGGQEQPVYRVDGTGRLGFRPRDGVFSGVTLEGETAHVREEMVFAFDASLEFENGLLPGSATPIVNFQGRGSIVLQSEVLPHSLEVTPDRGVVVPTSGLIGWFGRMFPRQATEGPFDRSQDALEFVGEGILLIRLT